MAEEYGYHTRPREVWDLARCRKEAKSAPANAFGDKPPRGIIVGWAEPYPQYGRQTFNGLIERGGELWRGTDYPFPEVAAPYALFNMPTWGAVIDTAESGAKRGLRPLELDADGRLKHGG